MNTPRTILLGLVLASVAKSVPSLGNPAKKNRRLEDVILLVAALAGALAGGIESNYTFNDAVSQTVVTFGLIIALVGKTVMSLKTSSLEDEVAFGLAVASLAFLPLGEQYAWTGVFFGFMAKELLNSPATEHHGCASNGVSLILQTNEIRAAYHHDSDSMIDQCQPPPKTGLQKTVLFAWRRSGQTSGTCHRGSGTSTTHTSK